MFEGFYFERDIGLHLSNLRATDVNTIKQFVRDQHPYYPENMHNVINSVSGQYFSVPVESFSRKQYHTFVWRRVLQIKTAWIKYLKEQGQYNAYLDGKKQQQRNRTTFRDATNVFNI